MSLKTKTITSAKWLLVNNLTQKAITFAAFLVLAHLLAPAAFGLFAAAFILIDGLGLFKTFGIDQALIRNKENVEEAAHTASFLIFGFHLAIFLVLEAAAPFAWILFGSREIMPLIQALGFLFLIAAFGKISQALLIKSLRFKAIAAAEMAASIVNAVAAVFLAFRGLGVWSLVIAYLAKQIVLSAAFIGLSGYRWRPIFRRDLALELFHFGKYLSGMAVLGYLAATLDSLLITRLMGVAALGLYTFAFNFTNLASTHFLSIIHNVMFPAYAAVRDDREAIEHAYRKIVRLSALVLFPFAAGLIVLGPDFIRAFYGAKWGEAALPLQILAIPIFAQPLYASLGAILMAEGKSRALFILTVLHLIGKLALSIPLIFFYGLIGAALSPFVLSIPMIAAHQFFLKRSLGIPLASLVREIIPALECAGLMAIFLILTKAASARMLMRLIPLPAASFGILALTGGLIYLAAVLWRDNRSLLEMKRMAVGA